MSIQTPSRASLQPHVQHPRMVRRQDLLALIAAATLGMPLVVLADEDSSSEASQEVQASAADAATSKGAGSGQLGIELNKLEQVDSTCRVFFVFQNQLDTKLEALQLELVLFDTEGFVKRRLTLDAAPIAEDKTSVKLFDLTDTQCERVGRILINDLLAIADPDGALPTDVSQLDLSSKSDVDLFK